MARLPSSFPGSGTHGSTSGQRSVPVAAEDRAPKYSVSPKSWSTWKDSVVLEAARHPCSTPVLVSRETSRVVAREGQSGCLAQFADFGRVANQEKEVPADAVLLDPLRYLPTSRGISPRFYSSVGLSPNWGAYARSGMSRVLLLHNVSRETVEVAPLLAMILGTFPAGF